MSSGLLDAAPGGVSIRLGAGFGNPAVAERFALVPPSPPDRLLRLDGVMLDPPTAMAFREGVPIEETRYIIGAGDSDAGAKRLAARAARELRGAPVFQAFNCVWLNYFHWTLQCLPAIALYGEALAAENGVLLLPPIDAARRRGIELLGAECWPAVTFQDGTPLVLDELVASTGLFRWERPTLAACAVWDRLADRVQAASPAGRAIYVWRVDSPARRLVNEDELVERLVLRGIEPVVLGTMTVDEQIALFRQARMVVAPHGAGLANLAFCRPGAVLLELLPGHYPNPCFNRLAQARGVEYWADIHTSLPEPGLGRHQIPFRADLELVERRLDEIDKEKKGLLF